MYLKIVLFVLGINVLLPQHVASVTVVVEQGILKGEKLWTITGDTLYNSFKGIPYAAPPVGDLRFKEAQPALKWEGIRNATAHGNVCPQFNVFKHKSIPGSEDCLFLNVYTPNLNPETPLSVVFFIHGGGYILGSGNVDNYGPDFLMNFNVVLVTINYRVDVLGFISLESEEVPGNNGLKDQVAALKWVNRNIRKFGGDPNKVTLLGQSAGAGAVTLHAISPMSKGLFVRAIAMSGVALNEYVVEFEAKRRALLLGESLGFKTENTTALLEFLKNVPVQQLIATNSSIVAAEELMIVITRIYFIPVVEKDFGQQRFLIEPPYVSIQNGRTHNDILVGYTSEEAIAMISFLENSINDYNRYPEILVPRNVFYQISPRANLKLADSIKERFFGDHSISVKPFVYYLTDTFIYNSLRYARLLTNSCSNNKVYLYQFSIISERNVNSQQGDVYGLTGTAHGDDLMYLFYANNYNLTVNKNSTSYRMIEQTCTLFTNFAKCGNPTPDLSLGVKWPQYNAETQKYMDIGEKLIVHRNPRASMMTFWKSIFDEAGVPF